MTIRALLFAVAVLVAAAPAVAQGLDVNTASQAELEALPGVGANLQVGLSAQLLAGRKGGRAAGQGGRQGGRVGDT